LSKFHHRLGVHLPEFLPKFDTQLVEYFPEWPDDDDDLEAGFAEKIQEAFGILSMDLLSRAIRDKSKGVSRTSTLVYVRHKPLKEVDIINGENLSAYLKWWDESFVPNLADNQFALLGISFQLKDPLAFEKELEDNDDLGDIHLKNTVFRILGRMKKLKKKDLREFFQTHKINMPMEQLEALIDRIMDKTKGNYGKTVSRLQALVGEHLETGGENK